MNLDDINVTQKVMTNAVNGLQVVASVVEYGDHDHAVKIAQLHRLVLQLQEPQFKLLVRARWQPGRRSPRPRLAPSGSPTTRMAARWGLPRWCHCSSQMYCLIFILSLLNKHAGGNSNASSNNDWNTGTGTSFYFSLYLLHFFFVFVFLFVFVFVLHLRRCWEFKGRCYLWQPIQLQWVPG